MKCPQCAFENPAAMVFCGGCGTRLPPLCSACGFVNPEGFAFCGKCGARVAEAAAPTPLGAPAFISPQAYTPKHLAERIITSKTALEGERKQVTVLFADLKGSMEMLAERDPEDARKLIDPVLQAMMDAVHHYEGTVNQVMGDGIMALFGAPLAHEDHAVRGCYAALRMQESIRRYTEEVRRTHGVEVQIRVGLNSGEVVVRSIGSDLRMDYTAVGQTTHLAARMEQLATPGTIRITADTLALAEGYVEVRGMGPIPVKGLAEPIEVYELTGAGSARTRLQAARARGLTRFVGRDTELDSLRHAAEQARAGRGQLVAVVGEPGVGKSRLYYEFIHSHHVQDWLVLESGSVSYGKATPYLPLADLLRSYFKVDTRDDIRGIRVKVTGGLLTLDETLKDAVPVVLWLLDALADDSPFLKLEPAERRRQTLAAAKRILLRENQVHPLLLLFEDLHWIDNETQAFLDSLVESLPASRILLAVNYRPEYRHGWANKTYYRQLRIDPLAPESAEDLLDFLLGTDPSTATLKRQLIERTQGSPLFLEESVRTLVETRALVGARGAYRLVQATDTLQVPATVQAILAARIDRLQPEEKRLLQAAAVIGNHVPFELLRGIAGIDEEELRRCLGQLQTAEFLYEAQLFPDLEYAFKHALTHEVAYGSVLQDRRRTLHAGIVEVMEQLYADRLSEHVERLAHHAARGRLLPRAVRYLREAGTRAASRSANLDAIAHFEEALALLVELPETNELLTEALEIRIALGPLLIAVKGAASVEVEQLYLRALQLVDRLGAEASRFPVLWGLWYVTYGRGEYPDAIQKGEQLLQTARNSSDSGHLLEAHHSLWPVLSAMGRALDALPHLERGMALYDRERHGHYAFLYAGHDPGACCRCHLGNDRWMTGYPDSALSHIQDAQRLAEELKHPQTTAMVLWYAARIHSQRGERELVFPILDRLNSIATQYAIHMFVNTSMFLIKLLARDPVSATTVAELNELLQLMRFRAGGRKGECVSALVEACANAGHVEEGFNLLGSITEAERHAALATEFLRLEGELILKRGRHSAEEAKRRFLEAINLARTRGEKSFELRAATSLARVLESEGRREEAHAALAGVYGWFTEGFDTADLKGAKALLDALA
jgi:class 3 adenylate cyclase/tetratricopeptide (TPR) repeat protein